VEIAAKDLDHRGDDKDEREPVEGQEKEQEDPAVGPFHRVNHRAHREHEKQVDDGAAKRRLKDGDGLFPARQEQRDHGDLRGEQRDRGDDAEVAQVGLPGRLAQDQRRDGRG
jgi:hypothetical protein